MHLYDFECWFTLLTGFAIFAMGLRVFWLDSSNRMYQAFMMSTFLLFVQNLFFFLMAQIVDLDEVLKLRPWQESSWNVAAFFIGITMWYYAKQFIPRVLTKVENYCLYIALAISLLFIFLQGFTPYGHGNLSLNDDQKWTTVLDTIHLYDWLRMAWTAMLYGVSVYFSYLPFKYAPTRASKWLRGLVFVVFSVILVGSFIQNYILTIFFHMPSVLNESINVAIGALFGGLMIFNLQLNDLNSDYAIPNLLRTMTNWFVLTDKNFNIRRLNAVFLENMGEDIIYWQNQPVHRLFDVEEWEKYEDKIRKLGKNETIDCEFRMVNRDKIYYLLFTVTPVFSRFNIFSLYKNRVKAYAFVGANLSQFKASENKTKAYAKELEASVRALESFAFIASHDLKEPIRNIGSFASLLKRRLGTEVQQDVAEYIEYIEQSVKSMDQLVNSIMDISRIGKEGLDFEHIDINELLIVKQEQMKILLEETKD